jgi:hypothetical protein
MDRGDAIAGGQPRRRAESAFPGLSREHVNTSKIPSRSGLRDFRLPGTRATRASPGLASNAIAAKREEERKEYDEAGGF